MTEAQKPNDNSEKAKASDQSVRMSDVRCQSLSYKFKAALDKFKLDEMFAALGAKADKKRGFASANTRFPESSDYHAHFEWRVRDPEKEITLDITFLATTVKPRLEEAEPYADNVIQWVGQFFRHPDANARIHADFEFETKKTTLSWFPLPLRTAVLGLGEGSIDGISVSLPSKPNGASRFFLSQINASTFVGIESERRIQFQDFSLAKELQTERSLADKFIEVKQ